MKLLNILIKEKLVSKEQKSRLIIIITNIIFFSWEHMQGNTKTIEEFFTKYFIPENVPDKFTFSFYKMTRSILIKFAYLPKLKFSNRQEAIKNKLLSISVLFLKNLVSHTNLA